MEQQKAQEARLEQMRLDEELARSIQQGLQPAQATSSSNTQPGFLNSAFGRMSGMLEPNRPPPPAFGSSYTVPSSSVQPGESVRRTLPWNQTTPGNPYGKAEALFNSAPLSAASGIKREPASIAPGFSSYATMQTSRPAIKSGSSSRPMPGTFRDDSSAASDSDIEIIPPSAFRDNGRHGPPIENGHIQQGIKHSPASGAAGQAAIQRMGQNQLSDALQMALFGNDRKQPEWMTTAAATQNPFRGKSEYVYPSSLHTPGPGLGYTMNNIPIYGGSSSGPSFASSSHSLDDLISRAGNQNVDAISQHLGLDASMNGALDYIVNDPRKTNQEIKDLLENIRPDVDLPPEDREGTPDGLVYPLVSVPCCTELCKLTDFL